MINQNETEILECFFPRLKPLTTKDIESLSRKDHETTFRLLKGLVSKGILKENKVGKTNVYDFIKDGPDYLVTFSVFVRYMQKRRQEFKEKHPLIYKRIYEFLEEAKLEDYHIAIIFGSFAKGTETKMSDIDLLCVTNRLKVREIAPTYKTKYDMNIQPAIVRISDFKNIRKDNPVFWDDLIDYGIIFEGIDLFFKEVYRDDRLLL